MPLDTSPKTDHTPTTGPDAGNKTGSAFPDFIGRYVSLTHTLPTDPFFGSQWHLVNSDPGLLDLNVTEVWESTGGGATYTGAGVRIAIIDDGVDNSHPDLDNNYDATSDYDFIDSDTDASPLSTNGHGTAVAGIIAAENNGSGAVGVAYDATIFGSRVTTEGIFPAVPDDTVEQITQAIDTASGEDTMTGGVEADIVNISLGTLTDNNLMDLGVPTPSLMDDLNTAINTATADGRGGLGTIIVKSAGNERTNNLDANLSSWNANKQTISVAAVQQDGFVNANSTQGSNLLVSAFGPSGEVVTTDYVGEGGFNSPGSGGDFVDLDYTNSFGDTSAAAAMVSGVVALMLEANPDLGWRDVQEILANSARHTGTDVGSGTAGNEDNAW